MFSSGSIATDVYHELPQQLIQLPARLTLCHWKQAFFPGAAYRKQGDVPETADNKQLTERRGKQKKSHKAQPNKRTSGPKDLDEQVYVWVGVGGKK